MNNLPTVEEQNLILEIANRLDECESEQLRADLKNTYVVSRANDNSRIEFEIEGYKRPPYKGQHPYAVEGKMADSDGAELSVLLHADENGRLLELEIVRWDNGSLIDPIWNTLKLY